MKCNCGRSLVVFFGFFPFSIILPIFHISIHLTAIDAIYYTYRLASPIESQKFVLVTTYLLQSGVMMDVARRIALMSGFNCRENRFTDILFQTFETTDS
jgi:hypothetical protein